MGRYGAENGPAKTARHFSLLLDSNTVFSGKMPKLMPTKFSHYMVYNVYIYIYIDIYVQH